MLKLIARIVVLFLLVVPFFGNSCKAGIETTERTSTGDIRLYTPATPLTVKDNKLDATRYPNFDWGALIDHNIKNTVYVRLIKPELLNYKARFRVSLSIQYYTDHTLTNVTTDNKVLTVDYDPSEGKSYKAIDTYNFTGAYKINVAVTLVENLDFPGDTSSPLSLEIGATETVDRTYTNIPPDANVGMTASIFTGIGARTPSASEQLSLGWGFTPGAEEYDVEWTTIDDNSDNMALANAMLTSTPPAISNDLDPLFRNNSTRITTDCHAYNISLMYNSAYILVRMRYVHYATDGIRVVGNWNYTNKINGGGTYQYNIWKLNWHEPSLNWQYSASFAEEGKKKEVVSYFDGTLRSRQTVTLNNSDEVAIAQENIYDEFGRSTASVLPAPFYQGSIASSLHFIPDFNKDASGNAYSIKNIFSSATSQECEKKPDGMDNSSGASKYYSEKNDFLLSSNPIYKKYNLSIPNANSYPFSVQQYTNDNTGRIKIQGGVGDSFQASASGASNTTKYYYGKPEQWELDQLFGNDAGYANHYLKNMVIDPNGQGSISYINASGKTVATALTALNPATLDPLSSISSNINFADVQILKPEQFKFTSSDLKITGTTTYIASSPQGEVKLSYNIPQIIDHFPEVGVNVCSSCYYKLTVKIVNDCGDPVETDFISDIIGVGSGTSCTAGITQTKTITAKFNNHVGTYYITFELLFDKKVIDSFADQYIDQQINNKVLQTKYDYIKTNFIKDIDFSGNYKDCKTCLMLLGTHADFKAVVTKKFEDAGVTIDQADFDQWIDGSTTVVGLYDALHNTCTASISTCDFHTCDKYKTLMKQDVSPGGQYSLFYPDGSAIEPEINVLNNNFNNVFGSNHAPATIPKEDYFTKTDGTVMSPYDVGFDVKTMVQYWKPSWAEKFYIYHPEFCKYQFCLKMDAYENWDEKVKQLYTKATDISNITNTSTNQSLTYNYTAGDWLLAGDPFFNTPSTNDNPTGSAYIQQMSDDLKNYSSKILNVSAANFNDPSNTSVNVLGLTQFVDYSIYRKEEGINLPSLRWNEATLSATDACRVKDKEWALYKTFYFQLKQKYYDLLRHNSTLCSNLTCDIGQPLETPLPGSCPAAQNFTIVANGISATPSMQHVQLVYTGAKFDTPVDVQLYYPSSVTNPAYSTYNALLVTKIPILNSAALPYGFDIPATLPPSTVHIANVTCTNNTALDKFANTVDVSESVVSNYASSEIQQWRAMIGFLGIDYGYFVYFTVPEQTKRTTVTLKNYAGIPVAATHAITIRLKYDIVNSYVKWYDMGDYPGYVEHAPNILFGQNFGYTTPSAEAEITILPGQKSGYFDYQSLNYWKPEDDFHFQQVQSISCVESLTGVTSVTGANMCPVTTPVFIPPACLAYQNKESRFPQVIISNRSIDGAQNAQLQTNNQGELTAQVANSCTSNAEIWMQKLAPGLAGTSVDKVALKARLIALCEAGGDFTHPFGVSALPATTDPNRIPAIPTATTDGDKNFGDVIKVFVPGKFTDVLNPWLINSPYPYDTPPKSTGTFISKANSTICTQLNNLYTTYSATLNGGTATDQGFYNYLVNVYGSAMIVSLDDLTTLRNGCACSGYFLNHDVQVAPFLDAGSQLSRADYMAAKAVMMAEFQTDITTLPNYSVILTNYMNQRFGFFYNYKDYLAFETSGSAVLYNLPSYTNINIDPYLSVKSLLGTALGNGVSAYTRYISDNREAFKAHYIATCSLAQASVNLQTTTQNYHYTLYYYDQADNLIRTVPPDGVNLLTGDKLQQVQNFRALSASLAGTIPNVPVNNADPAVAFSKLSDLLTSTQGGAVEMWFNSNGQPNINLVKKTPGGKFIFQLVTTNNVLRVDIFSTNDNGVTYTDIKYGAVNISAIQPLQQWVHVVVQSAGFASLSAGALKINVNGADLPVIGIAGTQAGTADNLTFIKHMRLYSRYMAPLEVVLNSASTTFMPINTDAGWYRFNVPAAGSEGTLGDNSTLEASVTGIYPNHTLATTYQYNSTNQVVRQNSPDGGTSTFWYDMLSRLTASQNAQQFIDGTYSYTVYDKTLGRVTEVGQKSQLTTPLSTTDYYLSTTDANTFNTDGINGQITQTFYDDHAETLPGHPVGLTALPEQDNLRKRVSASTYRESASGSVKQATYYNYDIDGNVKTLWQQIDGFANPASASTLKRIDYEYDLISGKVNFVRYQDQPGQPDKFYYKYKYDADNRLVEAWSGTQAAVDPYGGSSLICGNARMDAHYEYYLHGPMARMELGDIHGKVQGIDYAYTLQGWLKGVNSTTLSPGADISNDGLSSSLYSTIPVDAFGYALHYYGDKDYNAVGGTNAFLDAGATAGFKPLYNGNIAASSVNIPKAGNPMLYVYGYDQLNRLTRQDAFNWAGGNTGAWAPVPVNNHDYQERISYSANGNILTYNRNGNTVGSSNAMDELHYAYNKDSQGNLINNRLRYVNDDVTDSRYNGADLQGHNGSESQPVTADNYQYDAIGNLLHDGKEGINSINWTVYGKISSINKTSGNISYTYDAAGHRVSKTAGITTTYYVRDAQGNTLALYEAPAAPGGSITWREQHLYGSSRLGLWTPNINISTGSTANADDEWKTLGHKYYELNNHLGNVLATITDRVVPHYTNNVFDYYTADVATAQDYYPFGMLQPGRQYTANNTNYRYGFNGKENDNEVKQDANGNNIVGNQQDYGMRIYDPRVAKFLSVDPLTESYPWYTPYSFAGNNPIKFIDLDGKEEYDPHEYDGAATAIIKTVYYDIKHAIANTALKLVPSDPGKKWLATYPKDKDGNQIFGTVYMQVSREGTVKEMFNTGLDALNAMAPTKTIMSGGSADASMLLSKTEGETQTTRTVSEIEKAAEEVKSAKHHIATNKNRVSTARGGPWTPRFEKFFKNAGLNINNAPENLVDVINHAGPHPIEYHTLVNDRLTEATVGLKANTPTYKAAVINTLNAIGKEAQTTGSEVNRLLTK